MKKLSVAVLMICSFGCQKSSRFDYLDSNTELLTGTFELIFKSLLDTIPNEKSIFFVDTLSLESDVHKVGISEWIEGLPERWPKNELLDLVEGFTLNTENILIDELTLPYKFIDNPKEINNLSLADQIRNFGTIRLSNFVYNESKTKVVFFFICYCGNSCSKGGLIYVNRSSSRVDWENVEVLDVWGS
ncbi:hypothetical protein AWW67_06200 [Roseivirga seohaensis]|uniref:Uncharacterized protein n=1 Tax=Roseivirga seohaensis TaxID=1914963 RepID=A0A150XWL2_9BACT|nr:hypothetical protein [Roseivirga seohaensis]KYG83015.1 hypothetical protein AWW67_06200 [Roseivirga seohaensis]